MSDIQRRVQRHVAEALESIEVRQQELVTEVIVRDAIALHDGNHVLAIKVASDQVFRFSLPKAITAAATVLGAAAPVATADMSLAAVVAAIASLGALQGLRERLPRTCAKVLLDLLPEKRMGLEKLRQSFVAAYEGAPERAGAEFEAALEKLEALESVRLEGGDVLLEEYVIIRW